MIFEFPIHTNEVMNRGSLRGTGFSTSSRESKRSTKSTRSRIGDSPLTNKEFDFIKSKETSNTVADNYRHGPAPSERMKKFNMSQVPMAEHKASNSSIVNDYSSPNDLHTTHSFKSDQPPKGVTQNLRLLKTKMRLNSAASNESEPYVNINSRDPPPRLSNMNPEFGGRNFNGNLGAASFDDPSSALVS